VKPLVALPDVERLVVDALDGLVDATVGVGVPEGWTPAAGPHLEVVSDGAPTVVWPIKADFTVRLVARAGSPSAAKQLAGDALGTLAATDAPGIVNVIPLTGPLPGFDPQTRVALAATTARVVVRTVPIDDES
jgi:hypothetical protein